MAWLLEGGPTDELEIAVFEIQEKEVAVERQLSFV
jgi:hypothetical protein